MTEKYNGWTNRQNWNIALWINNDENLFTSVTEQQGDLNVSLQFLFCRLIFTCFKS